MEADVAEAVELFEREGEPVVVVAKFEDGRVGVVERVGGTVYVTSRPQPLVYYLAQSYYTAINPKLKVRKAYG